MSEDVSSDTIKKTQKSLGKYVKKPPLTEKLLRKPPFRFLHDIIITVIKETNYLKGLFTEDELNPDKVKDKEAKIAFLNKLIEAVKHTTNIDLPVRSSKIVAGLETENTNLLLQAIATALESKVDSSSYVDKIKSENGSNEKKVRKTVSSKEEKSKSRTKIAKEELNKTPKSKNNGNETPKAKKSSTTLDSTRNRDSKIKKGRDDTNKVLDKKHSFDREEKNSSKEKISPKSDGIDSNRNVDKKEDVSQKSEIMPIEDTTDVVVDHDSGTFKDVSNVRKDSDETLPEPITDTASSNQVDTNHKDPVDLMMKNQTEITVANNIEEHNRTTVVRPKSARPKSGEKRILSAAKREVPLPMKSNTEPSEFSAHQQINRPKSSLRPPSVRPSSARPGAPRLRPDSALPMKESVTMGNINVIVENVDLADDEETVVIETVSETSKDVVDAVEVSADNKGQLVEQILEQIAEEDDGRRKTEIDWETEAVRNSKYGSHKDVLNLRDLIQKMTKTANPLGKLINYLHEDIDAMHNELQIWSNTKRQLSDEIVKQKKISIEANKPLIAHLDQLQQEINKQQQEIMMTHSNILRNDIRIKELLSK